MGLGLLATVSPTLANQLPTGVSIVFHSGISAGAIAAILLNLLLNLRAVQDKAAAEDQEHPSHDAVRAAGADVTMPVPEGGAVLEDAPFDSRKS